MNLSLLSLFLKLTAVYALLNHTNVKLNMTSFSNTTVPPSILFHPQDRNTLIEYQILWNTNERVAISLSFQTSRTLQYSLNDTTFGAVSKDVVQGLRISFHVVAASGMKITQAAGVQLTELHSNHYQIEIKRPKEQPGFHLHPNGYTLQLQGSLKRSLNSSSLSTSLFGFAWSLLQSKKGGVGVDAATAQTPLKNLNFTLVDWLPNNTVSSSVAQFRVSWLLELTTSYLLRGLQLKCTFPRQQRIRKALPSENTQVEWFQFEDGSVTMNITTSYWLPFVQIEWQTMVEWPRGWMVQPPSDVFVTLDGDQVPNVAQAVPVQVQQQVKTL